MALALLWAFQAAAAAPLAPVVTEFDLSKAPRAERRGCGEGEGSEIVVCGRRRGGYSQLKMDPRWEEKPVRAEIGVGGGAKVRAYGESVGMPGGQISKRAMIGLKLPF